MPTFKTYWRYGNAYRVDFAGINRAALPHLSSLVRQWLPDGVSRGCEYYAKNPHRADRHLGSFCINTKSGKWADFAVDARGGDPISLAAYLFGMSQADAARAIAAALGIDWRAR